MIDRSIVLLKMDLKVFSLCCLLQLAYGQFTSESSHRYESTLNGDCHDFVPPVSYPVVWRNESVIESRHGVKIADPYRWLEDPYSVETKRFVSEQNKLSDSYLKNCDAWPKIHKKLSETYNYKRYTVPTYYGDYYYFQMNTGLQNQDILYRTKSLDDKPSVFLNPNEMSADGTVAISSFVFSADSKMMAYTFSKSGSDWNKLKIRNVETAVDYPETLVGLKFSQTSWTSDNKGFFYARYLKYGDGTETDLLKDQKIYYHRVGEDQGKDVLAFEFPKYPLSEMYVKVAGKYLIMQLFPYGNQNQQHLYYADLEEHGEIMGKIPLKPVYTADFNTAFFVVTVIGSKVALRTDKNAPNYRVVWIDLENPAEENWTTLIEENPNDYLLGAVHVGGSSLMTLYLHDVQSILQMHSLDTGKLIRKFPLGMRSYGGMGIDKTGTEVLFQAVSFLSPGTVYRYNFTDPNAKSRTLYEMKPNSKGFDRKNFEVKQVFYRSKDGTKIPMFIVQKLTTKNKTGPKPTLLYGYGGFGSPHVPHFSLDWFFFVNSFDGVFALANIRGGGEYGEKWHRDGILLKKQNSYDDFHAAAEYLIENKYTIRNKLAIRGLSNGGILVGVCINQRPDLYGAAVSQVGVHDMLRYHLFTYPAITIPEFGDPEKRADFENILKYSPLHNIHTPNSTQNQYPATLITTADHDDRVSPLHSFKFTAALQHAMQGNKYQKNPILMKLLKDAGHSGGRPTYKLINEKSDILTFLYRALSIEIDL